MFPENLQTFKKHSSSVEWLQCFAAYVPCNFFKKLFFSHMASCGFSIVQRNNGSGGEGLQIAGKLSALNRIQTSMSWKKKWNYTSGEQFHPRPTVSVIDCLIDEQWLCTAAAHVTRKCQNTTVHAAWCVSTSSVHQKLQAFGLALVPLDNMSDLSCNTTDVSASRSYLICIKRAEDKQDILRLECLERPYLSVFI